MYYNAHKCVEEETNNTCTRALHGILSYLYSTGKRGRRCRVNQNARKFDVIELAIKINPSPQTVGFSTSPVLVLGIGKKNPTKKGVKFYNIMWHLLNRNR